jgi:hypothetical protein
LYHVEHPASFAGVPNRVRCVSDDICQTESPTTVLDNSTERVGVLRRKIAALETLAMDPGTSLPESESAQTTANKLRLELSRLVRDGALTAHGGFEAPVPSPPPTMPPRTVPPRTVPPRTVPPRTRPFASSVMDEFQTPPNAMPWADEERERDTEPPPPPPVVHAGPRWLRYLAPGAALAAILGWSLWPEQAPAPAPAAPAAAPAPASAGSIDLTPRLDVEGPPPHAHFCKGAEDSVQATASTLLGRRRSGMTLTSASIDGCTGRFESRVVGPNKPHTLPAKKVKAVSSELGSALCSDASIRPALVEHGAAYTFAFYDARGKWLEDTTVSGATCAKAARR